MLKIALLLQKEMETNLVTMRTHKDLMRKVKKTLQVEDMEVHLPGRLGWTRSPWLLCGDLKTAAVTGSTAAGPSSVMVPVSCTWQTGFVENPIFSGAPSLQDTNSHAEARKVGVFFF